MYDLCIHLYIVLYVLYVYDLRIHLYIVLYMHSCIVLYTLGPALRILHVKNLGNDLRPEELRICPRLTGSTGHHLSHSFVTWPAGSSRTHAPSSSPPYSPDAPLREPHVKRTVRGWGPGALRDEAGWVRERPMTSILAQIFFACSGQVYR